MLVLLFKLLFQDLGTKILTNKIRVPWGGGGIHWKQGNFLGRWLHNCSNVLKINELYNYNEWILQHVNYTSIKLLKKIGIPN